MSLFKNTSTSEVREIDDSVMQSWVAASNPKASVWIPYTPPEPSPVTYSELDYANAIEAMFLAQARSYRYDTMEKAVTYVSSGVERFRLQALWLVGLRDYAWETGYALLANPPAVPPTPEQLAAQLLAEFTAKHARPPV